MTRPGRSVDRGGELKLRVRDAVNNGMGQRIARLCLATACCILLTACPPDEEPPAGPLLLPSDELRDRLRQDGFDTDDIGVYTFDQTRGEDRNIGSFGTLNVGGSLVDGCIEMTLVLHPTGERIDNFDGPVCWVDYDVAIFVELEMTTLGDE